jgi:hypothetical protein
MIEVKLENLKTLPEQLSRLEARLKLTWDGSYPLSLKVTQWTQKRSTSQNSLYWLWIDQLEKHVGHTKDDLHDLVKYKFLGSEEVTVGSETMVRLRSTTKLDKHAMYSFMSQVEAWALSLDLYLLIPADNDYAKMREAQM